MRFVVDAGVVLHLARKKIVVPKRHELLAPTLLRSQTLAALHEAVRSGEITREEGVALLGEVGPPKLKIRLLGDAVLRRVAWDLALDSNEVSTFEAEYLALTRLQADAFVTRDGELARKARGIVPLASLEALR